VGTTADDPACAVAHGAPPAEGERRRLAVVFASPVAGHLLHFGGHLGYTTVLIDPEPDPVVDAGTTVVTAVDEAGIDPSTDVVVTDHHRAELGAVLRDVLAQPARWIGVMGSPHRAGPHVDALRELGVEPADIARVHRPIGLNIGSRTPAEIAVATLAGLLADRAGRPGGFDFDAAPVARLG
jgi:xanthine/CO dehydrogenase XdhC/CoxF family maturation factor